MLNVTLDPEKGLAVLEPEGLLEQGDFESAASKIDPLIEEQGKLKGLVIHVEHVPKWGSFGALSQHLKFVRAHHREIERIAFVTDSRLGDLAEKIGNHFVAAEIKEFPFRQFESGKVWAAGLENS